MRVAEVDRFTVRLVHPWSPRGWLWVVVYDDVADLRRAADAYRGGQFDHSDTEACFQSAPIDVHLDDNGMVDVPAGPYTGVMRLLRSHGVATMAHEATHAACSMYLRQYAGGIDFTAEDAMTDEEILCYAVGDIVGGVTAAMQQRGHWS